MGDHAETTAGDFFLASQSIQLLRESMAAEARAAGFEKAPNAKWCDASTPRRQSVCSYSDAFNNEVPESG
jgi:hypothetical protein